MTMYLMHYKVIGYSLNTKDEFSNYSFLVTPLDFALLVLSTILIAGAGYIINDYFDLRIDRINKPDKVIVGKHIKKRVAMITHTFLNIIAILIGFYISYKYKNWIPLIFHLTTTLLLWWYSVHLKRKFLSGNLVIAIMSGMVPLLVGWLELPALKAEYGFVNDELPFNLLSIEKAWWIIISFSLFAFFISLAREIQKDIADIKGDEAQNCKTVPIVLGIPKTKYLIILILLGILFSVEAIQIIHFSERIFAFYIITFICLPILISALITHYGKERNSFLQASNFLKLAMLGAILFTLVL